MGMCKEEWKALLDMTNTGGIHVCMYHRGHNEHVKLEYL